MKLYPENRFGRMKCIRIVTFCLNDITYTLYPILILGKINRTEHEISKLGLIFVNDNDWSQLIHQYVLLSKFYRSNKRQYISFLLNNRS